MRTFSVWNDQLSRYDYFQSPGSYQRKGDREAMGMLSGSAQGQVQLGVAPEDNLAPLPITAVRVGSGPVPRGEIATSRNIEPAIRWAATALVLWYAYRTWSEQ